MTEYQEGIPPTPEINRPEENLLTPDYAAKVLYFSFAYSQGDPVLQKNLFRYIHNTRPNWQMTEEEKSQVMQLSLPMVQKKLDYADGKGKDIILHASHQAGIQDELSMRLNDFEEVLKEEPVPNTKQFLRGMIYSMIDRDYYFLSKGEGELRGRKRSHEESKWISHLFHYAFTGNRTGLKEYDELFSDINNYVRDGKLVNLDNEMDNKFSTIHDIYNQKHPEKPFKWD